MTKIAELTDIVGPNQYFVGDDIEERYKTDLLGTFRSEPLGVVRPKSTDEIISILKLARAEKMPIVPLGGNTGMSGGTSADNAIILSLERLNTIHEIDPISMTMTVDAGVTLQAAQEAAEAQGMMLPLDLGSRGSATIGGVLATNAGGTRVLRWGMAGDMALGLEVILADGTVVSSLTKMIKDNAGYNWKQLLIGSEGTLGIITRAVLRLRPKPVSTQTALIATKDYEGAIKILRFLETELGGQLSSFELMWSGFYQQVMESVEAAALPLPIGHGFYCLAEALGNHPERDAEVFESALQKLFELNLAEDAVIAQNERQRMDIWAVREDHFGVWYNSHQPYFGYDISMSQKSIPSYIEKIAEKIASSFPNSTTLYYGHIGDGNLHVVISPNDNTQTDNKVLDKASYRKVLDKILYENVTEFKGSISGEHGVGIKRNQHLHYTRTSSEIELMRKIKSALDPLNILNPGKVFPN